MSKPYQFALLGHNIAYSRSPHIFRAIADHTGLIIDFDLIDIPTEKLGLSLDEIVARGINGFSVTIPHKETLMAKMAALSDAARKIGAVNSVKVEDGGLYGDNTDVYGFALPLKPHRRELEGSDAIVVGSGGAARAVIYSLITDFELGSITVFSRTPSRLASLVADVTRFGGDTVLEARLLTEFPVEFEEPAGILVNCTPLGGFTPEGEPIASFPFPVDAAHIYYDLNYNSDNLLIAQARRAGIAAIDGTTMLVGQAIRSFTSWTGHELELEPIYRAVFGEQATS